MISILPFANWQIHHRQGHVAKRLQHALSGGWLLIHRTRLPDFANLVQESANGSVDVRSRGCQTPTAKARELAPQLKRRGVGLDTRGCLTAALKRAEPASLDARPLNLFANRGLPAGTMAVAKSRDPHARRLKPRATGCESRLRGLIEPASAGFVDVAEGFSPTASDFATAMLPEPPEGSGVEG